MTSAGAQYSLSSSSDPLESTSVIGVESKQNLVVVATNADSNEDATGILPTSACGQQLIAVVNTSDPSSPRNLQPIQLLVQDHLDGVDDSSNGSSSTETHVAAQVVVNASNTPHTIVESEIASTSTGTIVNSSPHYITVTVPANGETVGSEAVTHSNYVQYVEGDSSSYLQSNGQMTYPVYAVSDTGTMYTPTANQYYTPSPTTVAYAQVTDQEANGTTSQILSQGNGTFLIQQNVLDGNSSEHTIVTSARTSPHTEVADRIISGGGGSYLISGNSSNTNSNMDESTSAVGNMANANRVSQATVQWLLENYETSDGVSLPRSTLYNHYLRHCCNNKLDPVNAASFGKLIRSVFLGLRTRRLGTRGNSKYHYYGIRVKPSSTLIMLGDDEISKQQTEAQNSQTKKFKFSSHTKQMDTASETATSTLCPSLTSSATALQYNQYLGESSCVVPEFPEIVLLSGTTLPEECTLEDIDTFRSIYREHCEAFLDAVMNFEFGTVESLWREFWRSQDNNNGDECEEEKYLSKMKLYQLCKFPEIQEFIRKVDFSFYQNLVDVLMPDVLRPIPSPLTQAIRNFAKSLETWLTLALNDCPQKIMQIKLSAVSAFAQTLRRYTSLNHLAQAARAVLQNNSQINQMLADLNRVDFHNVQDQASWVCQCDHEVVQRLEADFKITLQQQNSLEQWAAWLKGVVTHVLKPYEGKPSFPKAARQFLLKWSFYSSMVIRDLTLRSAASFGSFHLIRLLYDEYMFYLIEHQVAIATGTTPIAVIGSKIQSSCIEVQDSCYADQTKKMKFS